MVSFPSKVFVLTSFSSMLPLPHVPNQLGRKTLVTIQCTKPHWSRSWVPRATRNMQFSVFNARSEMSTCHYNVVLDVCAGCGELQLMDPVLDLSLKTGVVHIKTFNTALKDTLALSASETLGTSLTLCKQLDFDQTACFTLFRVKATQLDCRVKLAGVSSFWNPLVFVEVRRRRSVGAKQTCPEAWCCWTTCSIVILRPCMGLRGWFLVLSLQTRRLPTFALWWMPSEVERTTAKTYSDGYRDLGMTNAAILLHPEARSSSVFRNSFPYQFATFCFGWVIFMEHPFANGPKSRAASCSRWTQSLRLMWIVCTIFASLNFPHAITRSHLWSSRLWSWSLC